MNRQQRRYGSRGREHGLRIVSQCLTYVENSIEEGVKKTVAISLCSQSFKIPKSNIWRWWKVFETYGENHIILNEQMRMLKKRYGKAQTSVTNEHLHELQRVVDNHPEYY